MPDRAKRKGKGFILPKGLRIDIVQRGARTGLRWKGRTADGVNMWEGTWRGLPRWFTTLFKCLGIGLYCLAAVFASIGLWQAVPGPAIAGTFHTFLGFFLFERLKYNLDSTITAEEAANQLRLERYEFEQLVHENSILPTHLFNDEPVYNLSSFGGRRCTASGGRRARRQWTEAAPACRKCSGWRRRCSPKGD